MMNEAESLWVTTALGGGWNLRIAGSDLYPPQLENPDVLIQFREGGDMDLHVEAQTQLTVPGFAMSALVRAFAEFMTRRGGE